MNNPSTSVREYFPNIYDNVTEINEIAGAEDKLFETALSRLDSLWKNSFISTCDESGIEIYERILKIVANPVIETLEFRRARILNRFAMIPSFTMPWLRARLDELLGEGTWSYTIDFNKREFIVETIETSQIWLHEVSVTIHHVKPANLIFISRPLQADNILVNEEVLRSIRTDNYKLGTWELGVGTFAQFSEQEVVKMPETPTIQSELLNQAAGFTADIINSVIINDKVEIPHEDFISRSSNGNMVSVEYEVYASHNLGTITNVKLRDAFNKVLAEMNVSIDNTFNVRMNHKIRFEEGINGAST